MPRYSILGLMLFTLGIAGGLAAGIAGAPHASLLGPLGRVSIFASILEGLWCSAAIWITFGLVSQAWDLYRTHESELPSSIQRSLRFGMFWRGAIAFLLLLSFLLRYVGKAIVDSYGGSTPMGLVFDPTHVKFMTYLLVMIAVAASRGQPNRPSRASSVSALYQMLAIWLAISILAIVPTGTIARLVAIALNGVESAHSLDEARSPVGLALMKLERQSYFVSQVQIACAIVAATALLGYFFLHANGQRVWSQLLMGLGIIAAGISIYGYLWFRYYALPKISPSFAEVLPSVPNPANALIAMVAVTYAAARTSFCGSEFMPIAWRVHPERYLHERRAMLVFLWLIAIGQIVLAGFILVQFSWPLGPSLAMPSLATSIVAEFLAEPANYWPLALGLLTMQQLWIHRRNVVPESLTYGFSYTRFGIGILLFGLIGVAIISAFSTWRFTSTMPLGWQ